MELWGGRFRESSDQRLADYTRSIELDSILAEDDLVGSIAHVHGLARAGLLSADEAATIAAGLEGLRTEVAAELVPEVVIRIGGLLASRVISSVRSERAAARSSADAPASARAARSSASTRPPV